MGQPAPFTREQRYVTLTLFLLGGVAWGPGNNNLTLPQLFLGGAAWEPIRQPVPGTRERKNMGSNGATGAIHKGAKAPNINFVLLGGGGLGTSGTTGATHTRSKNNLTLTLLLSGGAAWEPIGQPAPSTREQKTYDLNQPCCSQVGRLGGQWGNRRLSQGSKST